MKTMNHTNHTKFKTIKYTQIGEINKLSNLNNLSLKVILLLKQIKNINSGENNLNFQQFINELEFDYNAKYSNDWNAKKFIKDSLPHIYYITEEGEKQEILQNCEISNGILTFNYDKDEIDYMTTPEKVGNDFKFFFLSYKDIVNLTSGIKKQQKRDSWCKLYMKLISSVYNSKKTKADLYLYASTRLAWNFSHQELMELGFTSTNISRGELNDFVKMINQSKGPFKVVDLLKKSAKTVLKENNTKESGKFYKYANNKDVKTIYQFVLNTRRTEYTKSLDIQLLKTFNSNAFSVLDRFGIEYHFSRTRKIEQKDGGKGKAGVKGWNVIPSYGFDTWNNNEVLPSEFNDFVYPVVVFSKNYIVIDIDGLDNDKKIYYTEQFDTIYEESKNGVHLLFKNDLNFSKANTYNQGVRYRSGKVNWLSEDTVYDLRGMGKGATTTKLDGWNLPISGGIRNVSEFFDLIDLVNDKDLRENPDLNKQLVEIEEKNKEMDELFTEIDESFGD